MVQAVGSQVQGWQPGDAANIREAIGFLPGSRTLVIVGSSHKWYLEDYLNRMHDVRIVPTTQVLR